MTEQTTTNDQTGSSGDRTPKLSGVDLARIALQQARLAARNNGGEARAPRRRRATTVKRDGREPAGFAAVLQGLMADRAWELPAAGGSVLDQWPDIAAAVAPQLPHHIAAVAFHPETGQLDLRPDSSAYATQLRLITARIVATANEAAGTEAVRTERVLPPGGRSRASDRARGPGRRAGHSASAGEGARDGIALLPPSARRPPRSPASPARRPGCPGGNRVTDPRPARAQPARLPRPGR